MKKLLFITAGIQDSGGVSRMLSVKLNYLITHFNYKIVVVNSNYNKTPFFYHFSSKIEFHHLRYRSFFSFKNKVVYVIEHENPDVVINCDNGLKGTLLSYYLNKNRPLIYERHCSKNIKTYGIVDFIKLKISNVLLDYIIIKYMAFVVLNAEEKRSWKRPNVLVVPNPLWFEIPKTFNGLEKRIAIAVGRQSIEKRYDKLLKIWKEVVKHHPEWILKIYGQQNEQLKLKELVLKLELNDNVQFFDAVEIIEDVYTNASMLLMTSESEAFGLVILEAMAYGVPVVAFNGTSGTNMLIHDKINGFLIQKDDFQGFAEKVSLLINNQEARKLMGEYARNTINHYDLERIMKSWDDLFNSVS